MWRVSTSPIGTDLSAPRARFQTELDLATTRSGPFDDGYKSGDVSFRNNVLSSFLMRTRENPLLFVLQVPMHLAICAVNRPTCWVTTWSAILTRTVRAAASLAHPTRSMILKARLHSNIL